MKKAMKKPMPKSKKKMPTKTDKMPGGGKAAMMKRLADQPM